MSVQARAGERVSGRAGERVSASPSQTKRALAQSWQLGGLTVPNRVMLAPLAGIGNWFVRLQAKRFGAGMAVSEMVSSHALHHRNRRTCTEMLVVAEEERAAGPVAIQLFGADPEVMRSAAVAVAESGADAIDLNMGCPVPKVCRTGAGAALLSDHRRALALVNAAAEASELPVTVKMRSGLVQGDESGVELARRLAADSPVAAITMHPRSASVQHEGTPDYAVLARLASELEVPLILSGGLRQRREIEEVYEQTGATAVMLARGALGNPWLFSSLLSGSEVKPSAEEVCAELRWLSERAIEHLGVQRACRWMRRAYPWYLVRLPLARAEARRLQASLQAAESFQQVQTLLSGALAQP